MTPLNQPERKKAFINFLIFFAITVALIVAAVLFSVQVPFKQNDQLRAQLEVVENERDFTTNFTGIMDTTISSLRDLTNPEKQNQADLLDGRIAENLNSMQKMIDKENNLSNRSFYGKIVLALNELRQAKKDSRGISEKEKMIKELKERLNTGGGYPQQQPLYPQQ